MWGIHISKLDLCYAPDIEQGGNGTAGGQTITFPIAFSVTPALAFAPRARASDQWPPWLTWLSNTGATCWASSGARPSWIAIGW